MRRNRAVWLGVCAGVLFQSLGAMALDVSPELILLRGVPNAHLTAPLTLKNESPESVDVVLAIEEAGSPDPLDWVRVSPKKVKIAAGQSRVVQLKVRVPRRAEGERSAQVWVRARATLSPLEVRTVRRLILSIVGTERFELTINDVSVESQGAVFQVKAEIQNTGNVTLLPMFGADLTMSDGGHSKAYQKKASSLAPGERASARISVPSSGGRWEGTGTVTAQFRDADGKTHRLNKTVGD